jgi:hypothetical protein
MSITVSNSFLCDWGYLFEYKNTKIVLEIRRDVDEMTFFQINLKFIILWNESVLSVVFLHSVLLLFPGS